APPISSVWTSTQREVFPWADGARRTTSARWSPTSRAPPPNGSLARSSWWTGARGSPAGGSEAVVVGHYGVAPAIKRAEPKISLGVLFLATQLADILWGCFLLIGWEQVRIVPDSNPLLTFDFFDYPISHSLVGMLCAGLGAAVLYYSWPTRDTS